MHSQTHYVKTANLIAVSLLYFASAQSAADPIRNRLATAMRQGDETQVNQIAAEWRVALKSQAGEPEVADRYARVPPEAQLLTAKERAEGFTRYVELAERSRWWTPGLDATRLRHPLREPASLVRGASAVSRLALARDAAEFLLWAQEQAGTGVFPFPAVRGITTDPALAAADRFLTHAERDGSLARVTRNGWIIDDGGDGGLQFDNGEAGVALLDLHRATGEARYLQGARRAGEWALRQPSVPNWNYNSFSVWLLARLYERTKDARYLEGARRKARLGVLPGQLTSGAHKGRWMDAHNARPAYHYIMLRALAALADVLPAGDKDAGRVRDALAVGLLTRNQEVIERGLMNKDSLIEALLTVERTFAGEPEFLERTQTIAALAMAERFVAHEFRLGKLPLAPGPWGCLLARSAVAVR